MRKVRLVLAGLFVLSCMLPFSAGAEEKETATLDLSEYWKYLHEIHGSVAMEYLGYYGNDNSEKGFIARDDKFQLRSGTIGFDGSISKYMEYFLEAGVENCPFAGNETFRVLEAGLFYKPFESLRIGMARGHIMAGFELGDECTDLLTAEKPYFAFAIAPCHPTGAFIRFNRDFNDESGLDVEFAYLNDSKTNAVENEYDMNFGMTYRTPLPGFAVVGFFNYLKTDFDFDENEENAWRTGFGVEYKKYNIHFRSECYSMKGNYSIYDGIISEDLESRAFYTEGGYQFDLQFERMPYIKPYVMYQYWDKASNADSDQEYSYVNAGCIIGLGITDTFIQESFLRIEYEAPVEEPEGFLQESGRLWVRMQVGF